VLRQKGRARVWAGVISILATGAVLLALHASATAADSFVVIVNPSVPGKSMRRADLASVFLKKAQRWGDGTSVTVVDQSATSPVRQAFSENVLQMPVPAVLQYWQRQLLSPTTPVRLPTVKQSDEEVMALVANTSGAVGYVSSETVLPAGVKAVEITN
jgi:ABC-type phosphate transport system substrate-binding protein